MEYFLCQLLWSVILYSTFFSLYFSFTLSLFIRILVCVSWRCMCATCLFFAISTQNDTHSQLNRRMRERFCLFIVSMWNWNSTRTSKTKRTAECWWEKNVSAKQCARYKQMFEYNRRAVGIRTHKNIQNEPMAMGITTTPIHRKRLRHVRASFFWMRLILIQVFALVFNLCAFACLCECERCLRLSLSFFFTHFLLFFCFSFNFLHDVQCTYISHSSLNKQCQSPSNWFARVATG